MSDFREGHEGEPGEHSAGSTGGAGGTGGRGGDPSGEGGAGGVGGAVYVGSNDLRKLVRDTMRPWTRRVFVAFAALAVAMFSGFLIIHHEHDSRVSDNAHLAQANAQSIVLINRVAAHADHNARQAILATLTKESVCSRSNRDGACRALFDRIRAAMTRAQRKTVGCDVLAVLAQNHDIRKLRRDSHCP